jgi:hypothetical protein
LHAAIFLLTLELNLLLLEEFVLILGNILEKDIAVGKQNFVLIGKVAGHRWQEILVHHHDGVKGTLSDLQGRQVRKEVIANEETEKHEVVNQSFEVEAERKFQVFELEHEVLSDHSDLDELKLN